MLRKITKLKMLLLSAALFLTFVLSFPTRSLAASNKAAKLSLSFQGQNESNWDKNTYSVGVMLPKTSKLKSTTTVSYEVCIPKTVINNMKKRDTILFCMDLNLLTYNKKYKGYAGVGSINKRRWANLSKGDDGKVYLDVYNESTDTSSGGVKISSKKTVKSGTASLTPKGNYYVLKVKDTLSKKYYDYASGKDKTVKTNVAYTLIPELVVHGDCKKLSGSVYLNSFTVKTAKTQTVTFKKGTYKEIYGRHYGGKNWSSKAKVVSLSV